MCGISGKIKFNSQARVSPDLIKRMNEALKHRGPDNSGIYVKNNVGLGHTRLKVIDLSNTANQPMSNEDKTCWITFNGEIYNFKDLRKNLISRGHKFVSHSDTETVIHLYEEYQEGCLKYLRGMFAFAIWDEKKQKLFLARDRIGKKPLKYYIGKDFLIFASELKAILKDPDVKKEPDLEAIHHYLTFQFTPAPFTGFKNINKLPPAHYLIYQNGKIEIKNYWKLNFKEKWYLKEEEWKSKILKKLEEAIKIRLISDVPLGIMLSGGIDSSAIVAITSIFFNKPIDTFSIGFEEKEFNELKYAEIISKKFNTHHHRFIVKPNAIEILPTLAYFYEEPFADSSAIPTFYLSQLTKKYVTVTLNGDGGDENFAGYNRYNALILLNLLRKFPKFSTNIFRKLLKLLAHFLFSEKFNQRGKILKLAKELGYSEVKDYFQIVSCFDENEKENVYTDKFKKLVQNVESLNIVFDKFKETEDLDFLDRLLYVDINFYLPDDLLIKMDIATMAHSLEARSPFLDHEFMELTAKIPSNLKIKRMDKKYILKKALEEILPSEILNRKKMGFRVPIEKWFKNKLKRYLYEILLSKKFLSRDILKKEKIKEILDKHTKTNKNLSHQIWSLLTLEYWFRQYFD